MNRKFLFHAALLAVISLTHAVRAQDESPEVKAPPAKAANKICPMSGEANGADSVTVEHRGKTITLCCKMCRGQWSKMTDAQRDAKLGAGKKKAASTSTPKSDPYPLGNCPVSGEALGAMGGAVIKSYDGREVRFCCNGCVGKFEKSRDLYFMKIDDLIIEDQEERYPLETCLVSGGKLGGMGDPVDVVIGNRLYRLCCEGCRKKLTANLATYRAKLDDAVVHAQSAKYPMKTCVVSGKKLGSMGKPPEIVVAGRLVRFCCKGCVGMFQKAPASYIAKLDAAAKATPEKKDEKKDENKEKSDPDDG